MKLKVIIVIYICSIIINIPLVILRHIVIITTATVIIIMYILHIKNIFNVSTNLLLSNKSIII